MARKSRIQDNETEVTYLVLPWGGSVFIVTNNISALTSQTKDIEELWTHRTNENHTVFYRSLCDVDSYMPCYSLEYLTEAQIKMTRHQRWLAAGVQMLFFKGKCQRIQIFMHVWRLNLVWQEQSINMEWRPCKTAFEILWKSNHWQRGLSYDSLKNKHRLWLEK